MAKPKCKKKVVCQHDLPTHNVDILADIYGDAILGSTLVLCVVEHRDQLACSLIISCSTPHPPRTTTATPNVTCCGCEAGEAECQREYTPLICSIIHTTRMVAEQYQALLWKASHLCI